jgi:hypothetical protein
MSSNEIFKHKIYFYILNNNNNNNRQNIKHFDPKKYHIYIILDWATQISIKFKSQLLFFSVN